MLLITPINVGGKGLVVGGRGRHEEGGVMGEGGVVGGGWWGWIQTQHAKGSRNVDTGNKL